MDLSIEERVFCPNDRFLKSRLKMNFVVALQSEANPIIDHFEMKRESNSPFPRYSNLPHRLIVTGIGRLRCAAATGLLMAYGRSYEAWLNFGFAGHAILEKGTTFQAHKISDDSSPYCHYPPLLLRTKFPTSHLRTVSRPETKYMESCGYDMEAHAFCSTAYQHSTRELVQVVKVVSDNPNNCISKIDRKEMEALLFSQMKLIHEFVNQLDSLADEIAEPSEISSMLAEITTLGSFSQTQVLQIRKYLFDARSLGFSKKEIRSLFAIEGTSRSILRKVEMVLNEKRILP